MPTDEQGGGVVGSLHIYYKLLNRMAGLFHTHEQVGGFLPRINKEDGLLYIPAQADKLS